MEYTILEGVLSFIEQKHDVNFKSKELIFYIKIYYDILVILYGDSSSDDGDDDYKNDDEVVDSYRTSRYIFILLMVFGRRSFKI